MKRIIIFALICAAIFAAAAAAVMHFCPAAELSYSFSMPYTDEQELCISWNFSGAAVDPGPDPYLSKSEKYISIEFFDYPGEEARFLLYTGVMHYEYSRPDYSEAWQRLNLVCYPDYDSYGYDISFLF